MVTAKSPYNFVPAPTTQGEVFFPKWAERVSHDIPFSDAVSGELHLRITARTPIFIRNGQSKNAKDSCFSHICVQNQRRYFIPATSLKGMLRSVLEILSRSKMTYINDHRHAVRQIIKNRGEVADEGYSLVEDKGNIYAGYLVKREGSFYIYPCGKPYKIRYTELDEILPVGRKFGEHFKKNGRANIERDFSNKTGRYKYEQLLQGVALERKFEEYTVADGRPESWKSRFQPLDYVRFAQEDYDKETFWGRIVCTGQAMTYNNGQARKGEYVFKGRRADVVRRDDRRIEVEYAVMRSFLLTCRNGEHDELDDWKYWKKKLKEGVPVFFRYENNDGKRRQIRDFGLTFMYKEPTRSSVAQCLPYGEAVAKPDFVEALFGYVDKDEKDALKGRVMVAHAFATGNPQPLEEREIVLASPKSSYYPFYLKQSGKNGKTKRYNTYNHNPQLRGYKRYPVHGGIADHQPKPEEKNLISRFQPLPAGTEFVTKIRFHNLKPAELGGILSALTFHGQGDQCFHSLGGAKPFGYGRVQIEVTKLLLVEQAAYRTAPVEEFLEAFACEMKNHDPNWHKSAYWRELLAMARLAEDESRLAYMELDDFSEVKKQGLYLQDYSELTGFQLSPLEACASPDAYKQADEGKWQQWEAQRTFLREKQIEAHIQKRISDIEKTISEGEYEKALTDLEALAAEVRQWPPTLRQLKRKALLEMAKARIAEAGNQEVLNMERDKLEIDGRFREVWEDVLEAVEARREVLKEEKAREAVQPFDFGENYAFEAIKRKINHRRDLWQRLGGRFTEEQLQQIEAAVRKSFEVESQRIKRSKFHRHDKPRPFHQLPWTNIKGWLGEDRAQVLYQELVGN